jgi:hypothetical protein
MLVAPLLLAEAASGQGRQPRGSGSDASSRHHHHDHHAGHHHHHGHRHRHSHLWFDAGFPLYWGGGYTPAFGAYYPSYSYFGYSVVLPPVTVLNVTPINVVAVPPPQIAAPAAGQAAANNLPQQPAAPSKPKATNAGHKARAGRFLGLGDANFAEQRYLSALERYKTAMEVAPDMPESYFRQGIAQVALAQYESAARAFRRGLQVRSDWNAAPFRLDDLYDSAPLAKTRHLEELARAVESNPFDSELLLALGMQLFFEGETDRARVFFERSAQLGGNDDRLLDGLLGNPKPAGDAGAQRPGAKISF